MLKFFFWILLCINGALFAYSQGYLGAFKNGEHEPARLKKQFNGEKLALMSADDAARAVLKAKDDAAQAQKKQEQVACLEVGSFAPNEAKRFEAELLPLALGDRQSRHNVQSTDITTHIVYIPPQGSKEAADKKAGELKQLGVTNFFVMSEPPMKWGISLGVFKSEAAAQTLLAALVKQGVHSARITGRGALTNKLAYQFRNIDVDTKDKLEKIKATYAGIETDTCK
ncbi:MAG: SPOR domain-containing protein [Pseudomonadota bacterium]